MPPQAHPGSSAAAALLATAVNRAASHLEVSDRELDAILRIGPSPNRDPTQRSRPVALKDKEAELAVLFIRVFRDLDFLFGGNAEQCRRWLRAYNHHLAGVPLELLQNAVGLVRVSEYLEARPNSR